MMSTENFGKNKGQSVLNFLDVRARQWRKKYGFDLIKNLVMFKNLPPTTSERGKNLPPSGPGGKNPTPAGGTYLTGYKGTCLRMYPPATCGGWILKQVPKHPV